MIIFNSENENGCESVWGWEEDGPDLLPSPILFHASAAFSVWPNGSNAMAGLFS